MENLKLYRISDHYIRFLKSRDSRVQDNKNRRRPYVGVVLYVGEYKYFVPMESPKPNHANIKPSRHIMKLDGGRLGLLGFNNMIPVHEDAIILFDINAEPDAKYADLLRRQVTFINRNKADVMSHATKTYYNAVKGNNNFLQQICCDFKKLETACTQYNPTYRKKNKTAPVL
ncbi:MAG: type III toxin-antitoxin system ToxN/AbiQ family toxin [Oscillospiraceae bacterium]